MDPAVQQVADALSSRRLGRRDRQLQQDLGMNRAEEYMDRRNDLKPHNLDALMGAIDAAKDPKQKQVLMDELRSIIESAPALVGPKAAPPPLLPAQMMPAPFNPQDVTTRPYVEKGPFYPPQNQGSVRRLPFPAGTY